MSSKVHFSSQNQTQSTQQRAFFFFFWLTKSKVITADTVHNKQYCSQHNKKKENSTTHLRECIPE